MGRLGPQHEHSMSSRSAWGYLLACASACAHRRRFENAATARVRPAIMPGTPITRGCSDGHLCPKQPTARAK